MITTNDIQALIAFAILNNKSDLIKAMNVYGYYVETGISDEDLFLKVWNIYRDKGLTELKKILALVPINKGKVTEEEAKAFAVKFQGANPNAKTKAGEWLSGATQWIGDFLGGVTNVIQNPTTITQQKKSILPAWVVPVTAILGIGIIAYLFSKGIKNALAISIVIGIIIIVVMLYGVFATETTLSQTGGGGTQQAHGGVGDILLGWLSGGLGGLFGGGGNNNLPPTEDYR